MSKSLTNRGNRLPAVSLDVYNFFFVSARVNTRYFSESIQRDLRVSHHCLFPRARSYSEDDLCSDILAGTESGEKLKETKKKKNTRLYLRHSIRRI